MSTFLYHEPCPQCGSSDALAVFDDHHKYCFSCHYYEGSNPSIEQYMKKREPIVIKESYNSLPKDFDYNIGHKGIEWLKKYSLTQKEISDNRIGWSEQGVVIKKGTIHVAPLLVFPVFDRDGTLLMWQGRNFGEEGPKYITRGAKDVLHILGETSSQVPDVVLTEDLISAIKVSRVAPAMPLWGSYMSLELARRLSKSFGKAVLWLDKDKAQEAHKQASNASYIFEKGCGCIRTERDPKEYKTEEIKEIINGTQ